MASSILSSAWHCHRAMSSLVAGGLIAVFVCAQRPLPSPAAEFCDQMNGRIFGADGRGGDAARFRQLKARIDQEKRDGNTQAARTDSVAYKRLAETILESARTMLTANCRPRIVAQGDVLPRTANTTAEAGPTYVAGGASSYSAGGAPVVPPAAPPATMEGQVLTRRSAHGCVGFRGNWQTQTGLLTLNNGTGTLGRTWFIGDIIGTTYSGGWADPQPGYSGTFVFTLAPDGDSIYGVLRNTDTGATGSWTASCVGQEGTTAPGGAWAPGSPLGGVAGGQWTITLIGCGASLGPQFGAALTQSPAGGISGQLFGRFDQAQKADIITEQSSNTGAGLHLLAHPDGWASNLEFTGRWDGSKFAGRMHHYTSDDCDFTIALR